MLKKKDYLMTAVGNPEGDDKPNKKYFDVSATLPDSAIVGHQPTDFLQPRVWVREGEKTMSARVAEALKDFNTAGTL